MSDKATSQQAKAKQLTVWVGYKNAKSKGTKLSVTSISLNGYSVANGYIRNDVALLKLSKALPSRTAPLAVAPSRAATAQGTRATLYGAGETDANPKTTTSGTLHATVAGEWSVDSSCALSSQGISCLQRTAKGASMGAAGDSGGPWVATIDRASVLMTVFTGYAATRYGPNRTYGTAPGFPQTLRWLRKTAGIPDLPPGTIVRDPATAKSWLISSDGYRLPIADQNTFVCLTGQGARVANLPGAALTLIAARTRNATCAVHGGKNVLVVGTYQTSTDWLSSLLQKAGYIVTVVSGDSLPADISGYGQIWDVSIEPLSDADQNRLVTFARQRGGVYLTGERPCCESVNAAAANIINKLVVTVGGVEVGGLGDPYEATGPLPVNPKTIGSVTQRPFALTTWQPSAPGGMANVSGNNVLSTATPGSSYDPSGRAVAAAWDRNQVVGAGRLVILMDVNWMESGYRDEVTATKLAQNLALFLSGLASPPAPVVQAGASQLTAPARTSRAGQGLTAAP